MRAPGVKLENLPPIHLILISHDHYDHLDIPSLKKIVQKHNPVILTGLGVKQRIVSVLAKEIIELDWWDTLPFTKEMKFPFDKNKTLWGGFIIHGGSGNVIFMGDTAYGEFVEELKAKDLQFRLAILPIGSYEKRWFMKNQHMNPDDAVRFHKHLNIEQSVGIHFATFNEHPEQTIDAHETDLTAALKKRSVPASEFWVLNFGEGRNVP